MLSAFQNRRSRILSLFGSSLGIAWTLVTYLVIPVFVIENLSVSNAVQRSVALFRNEWGEEVAGNFGFGLLGFLLCLPAFLIAMFIYPYDKPFAVIMAVDYLLIIAVFCSAVKSVFTVALYHSASRGEAPAGFSGDLIDRALGARQRSFAIPPDSIF